jgi:nucleotide-binding universal stress UspA family protein
VAPADAADHRSVSDRIVIVGYDGQPQAADALALGALLARSTDGRLLIAHAHNVGETTSFGRALFDASRQVPYGVRVETRAVAHDTPAAALATLADEEHADVVVVGSSHRGSLGRALLGSVGEQLLRQLPCSLAVAPRDFAGSVDGPIETIGVAFDGREESLRALDQAAALAGVLGARLRLIAVIERPQIDESAAFAPNSLEELTAQRREELERALMEAAASIPPEVPVDTELLSGPPTAVISERCREDVDLLVAGSHAYGPLRRVFLGSVSTQLMRSCPCPLYVVPRGATQPSARAAA